MKATDESEVIEVTLASLVQDAVCDAWNRPWPQVSSTNGLVGVLNPTLSSPSTAAWTHTQMEPIPVGNLREGIQAAGLLLDEPEVG